MNFALKRITHGLIFIAVLAAAAGITMLLWNVLIPSIIGWSTINYWQAIGLLVLCRLLFGGIGRHRMGMHGFGHHLGHHKHHAHLHDRFKGMSHEEKREFIRRRMSGFHDEPQDKE